MARAQVSALLLVAALAMHSSCGGPSHDLPRLAAAKVDVRPVAPPVRPPRVAAAVAAPAPRLPLPADGFAEHADNEAAMRAALEQRYPLHGVAFHMQAQIFSEPNERGQPIGYMRRGTRLRAAAGTKGGGCDRLWHELATGGFVCAGRGFALGAELQSFEPSPPPASMHEALPYPYAKNVARLALQYWRVPSMREEQDAMRLLAEAPEDWLRQPASAAEAPPDPALAAAEPAFALPEFARMAMEPGFYVSVDRDELADAAGSLFGAGGACAAAGQEPAQGQAVACGATSDAATRAFVRTVRGAFVPAEALAPVAAPSAPGTPLEGPLALPLGIVYRGTARQLLRDPLDGQWFEGERLARHAHIALTGARIRNDGHDYLLARSGVLIAEPNLRIARRAARPPLVPKRARWIHVRLEDQTLVAYDGDRPVFATLVATGKEGFDTPTGLFRIHAKHVSATMDGLAGSDDVYSIEDVPWTLYFQGSYALHAAFWHDRLGAQRSHGCVNLAPEDARWLFGWTTPGLPAGWHGALATRDNPGTYVFIE